MVPALASVIFAWLLIVLGLSYMNQAYAITSSSALNLAWETNTNFLHALYEGAIGTFIQGNQYNFNSVLWTMKYEFIGSFIVFIVALLFSRSQYRYWIYGALIVALFGTWYWGFVLGMVLADIYVNRKKILDYFVGWRAGALALVGISLGAFPWDGINETVYRFIQIPGFTTLQSQAIWGAIGAFLLIVAIMNSKLATRLLSSKPMTTIGAHTFSLYLVHQPIIYTAGLAFFVAIFAAGIGYTRAVIIAALLVTPIIAVVTIYFYKFVEQPSIKLSSKFEKVMSRGNDTL